MAVEFKLPELGENVESGTVTKILVSEGDNVTVDQPVLEIETDKAVLEVPSKVSGTIKEVHAKEGESINVGDLVFVVAEAGEAAESTKVDKKEEEPEKEAKKKPASKEEAKEKSEEKAEPEPEEDEPAAEEAEEEKEEPKAPAKKKAAPKDEKKPAAKESEEKKEEAPRKSRQGAGPVPAAPSVRGFAREIGVDINEVEGTGPGGRISLQDVKNHARTINTEVQGASPTRPVKSGSLPDFSRWGEIDRQPMSSVRRRTAENMAAAWTTVPHVTQFEKADITDLEKMRKQYGKRVEEAGGKLTMTAIIVKVLEAALKKFPQFNASIDLENEEIIYKKYVNVGVAVDTDRGLLVPVVKNVNQKSLTDICVEIVQLAEKARDRKITLDQMQGATFTVSNLGGIAGTYFTPIVNSPEVAILGVSRSSVEPVYTQTGAFEPRTMLPLSLSYDHRVIDGADGARFIRFMKEVLEQPFLLFLEA